jgi:hypothetical protein
MRSLTVARRAAARLRLPIGMVLTIGAVVAAMPSVPVEAQTASAEPLVKSLVYQGAFRVPAGGDNQHTFEYGGRGVAFDARDNGLWMIGHDQQQWVAEMSIPAPSTSTSLSALPRASLTRNFRDVLAGKMGSIGTGGAFVGGVLPWDDGLVASGYIYYDASKSQRTTHVRVASNGSVSGPYEVGSAGAGMVSGWMTPIPSEWQSALGGPALTGQCCIPIISRTSLGPSATVFDPSNLAKQSDAKQVLGYPHDHPTLGTYEDTDLSHLFLKSTAMGGMIFPGGTSSVLFIGVQAGSVCYGEGTKDQSLDHKPVPGESGVSYCYDPSNGYKGTHGYPYRGFVWAYSANDLVQVKQGHKNPWDVKPYATWTLTAPFMGNSRTAILGATYDPATRRVFVSLGFADGTAPVVAVYGLNTTAAAADSTPPSVAVTSPGNGASVSGTVTLAASASDNTGVASVWFTVDNVNVGAEDSSLPYQTTWNTASAGGGTHTIRASARDWAGNARTSSPVSITVSGSGGASKSASSSNSSACTSQKPVANWVCVGTGWLPPDHPLAIAAGLGGITPAPAPKYTASASVASSGPYVSPVACTTMKPVSNWICVEGGWLPPDHPVAIAAMHAGTASSSGSGSISSSGGSSPPSSSNTSSPASSLPYCSFGGSPVAGWVYVAGGWVPTDHPLAVLGTCRAH